MCRARPMGQSHGKGHAFIFETGVLAGAHQIVMAQSAECFLYLQKTAPALPTECENGYFLYFFNTINKGTDPEYALIDSTTIPVHQNVSGAKGIHCHKPSGTWRSDTACDAKWLLKNRISGSQPRCSRQNRTVNTSKPVISTLTSGGIYLRITSHSGPSSQLSPHQNDCPQNLVQSHFTRRKARAMISDILHVRHLPVSVMRTTSARNLDMHCDAATAFLLCGKTPRQKNESIL